PCKPLAPINHPSLAMAWRRPGRREVGELQRANLKGHRLCHQMEHAVQTVYPRLHYFWSIDTGPPRPSASQPASQPASDWPNPAFSLSLSHTHTHTKTKREGEREWDQCPALRKQRVNAHNGRANPGLGTERTGRFIAACTLDP